MAQTLRFLGAEDIRSLLPMPEAVRAVRTAFRALSEGRAVQPLRTHIEIEDREGSALFMPSFLPELNAITLKTVTLFQKNPELNLPTLQALVLLADGSTGTPLAVLEGATLTALRTGAASGLATDLLADPDSKRAVVFGAGVQGRAQLEAVAAVRKLTAACVFDPNKEAAERFAEEMESLLRIPVEVAPEPRAALQNAHVVCTATTSRTPVFQDSDLPQGVHINAVGSYKPDVREIPAQTVARAYVVVDHRASALAEAGDLLLAIKEGLISEKHICAELGEIAAGRKCGRTDRDQITLFKSVGVAVQDAAVAAEIYRKAVENDAGVTVNL